MWLVMRLQRWENYTTNIPLPFKLEGLPHTVGFLPVYDTLETAMAEWPEVPTSQILEIAERPA